MTGTFSFTTSPDFINAVADAVAARLALLMTTPASSSSIEAVGAQDTDLTVADAAKILRYSQKHVRDLIKAKVLPGRDRNKGTGLRAVWRLSRKDVEAYRKNKR
ncbi:MAG: hypothetical protein JWP58_2078 [Hymenobacter sp.]|nr:hypothetical protein [Hymenobacter sp.]